MRQSVRAVDVLSGPPGGAEAGAAVYRYARQPGQCEFQVGQSPTTQEFGQRDGGGNQPGSRVGRAGRLPDAGRVWNSAVDRWAACSWATDDVSMSGVAENGANKTL